MQSTQLFVSFMVSLHLSIIGLSSFLNVPPLNHSVPSINSKSDISREKPQWFTVRFNNDPPIYLTSVAELRERFSLLPNDCLPSFSVGDRLNILFKRSYKGEICESSIQKMNATSLIALGIKLELNSADHSSLKMIPGIGDRMAKLITEGRPWSSLDQLTTIKGVGAKKLQKLRQYLSLKTPMTLWSRGAQR